MIAPTARCCASTGRPRWEAATHYSVLDDALYRHTIIEAIDPRRGVVLARTTLPGTPAGVGPDLVGGIVESELGVPCFRVWRLRLTGRQPS
jgi:hypothetical protein